MAASVSSPPDCTRMQQNHDHPDCSTTDRKEGAGGTFNHHYHSIHRNTSPSGHTAALVEHEPAVVVGEGEHRAHESGGPTPFTPTLSTMSSPGPLRVTSFQKQLSVSNVSVTPSLARSSFASVADHAADLSTSGSGGGNLLQRSIVRGRHRKGMDIVGEADPDDALFVGDGSGSGAVYDEEVSVHGDSASVSFMSTPSRSLNRAPSAFDSPAVELTIKTTSPQKVGVRGITLVATPSCTPLASALSSQTPAVEPKTPKTKEFIIEVLSQHYLFSSLAPSELSEVVDAMQPVPVAPGELVVRQGDVLHNAFFVVQRGMVDMFGFSDSIAVEALADLSARSLSSPRASNASSSSLASGPAFLMSVSSGGTFGEAALMYTAPADVTIRASQAPLISSASTVTCPSHTLSHSHQSTPGLGRGSAYSFLPSAPPPPTATEAYAPAVFAGLLSPPTTSTSSDIDSAATLLWRLDRRTFRKVLASTAKANLVATNDALRSISFFKDLPPNQLSKLAYAVREVKYHRGDKIITKGEKGDCVYFLLDGTVMCTGIGSGLTAVADVPLAAGACFGERALLLDEPRAADVVVTSEVASVLSLDRYGATQLLGPLQELLDRNMVIGVLKGIPLFSQLSEPEYEKLAAGCIMLSFTKGESLVKRGEPCSNLLVVRDGAFSILDSSVVMRPGDYVGLEQLIRPGLPLNKSIVCAADKATCYSLQRESVIALFGTMKALLARGSPAASTSTDVPPLEAIAAVGRGAGVSAPVEPVSVSVSGPEAGSLPYLRSVAKPLDTSVQLGDLEKIVTVGVGTFGRVFMVRHRPTDQLFALKELKKATLIKLNQLRNVQYERAVMAAVRHPFVLRLVNTYQDDTKLYMLTEYIHGGELFNLLGEYEKLTSSHARFYAGCVLSGLAHLHSIGIVYRDLKPENLLIDRQGYIRIVDFGFCKHIPPGERTYTLCGTPAYIAYEMVKGTGYTVAVDYWALGTLIYEMLVGYAPYEGEDQMTTFRNILQGNLEFPDFITDGAAMDIVRQLLAKDVVDRLGCRKAGVAEIFEHPWFAALDFAALVEKTLEAPWLPELEAEDDVRYFESYEDDIEDEGVEAVSVIGDADSDVEGETGNGLAERYERDVGTDDDSEPSCDDDDTVPEDEAGDTFVFDAAIPSRLAGSGGGGAAAPSTPLRLHSTGSSRSMRSSSNGSGGLPWFDGF